MNEDLLRYSCQIALPGFGEATQQLLTEAKVLVVGAGGLGCPALQYLASTGVGTIGIADYDIVSISNLHRQVLFSPADKDFKKAMIATKRLQRQNLDIKVVTHDIQVTAANVMQLISGYDIVVDCTDNFETRYLLNDAGVLSGKPVVYGAIYQYEGQVAVWNVKNENGTYTPNYRDLFADVDATQVPSCAVGGVIPTLAGIIGCMQANEVIKYITKTGDLLKGKVLIFDAQSMQSRIIKIGSITKTNIITLPKMVAAITMSIDEVKKGLEENTLELLDIRTDQERDEIDIGGEHIEVDELEDHWDYINNGITKVLYCSSGKRSGEAVKMIKQKFPEAKVFSLEGGLGAWFSYLDED
jgi:molybdopterin/thiamine biosynthesis adenylyltransferase/rhodanese-related sulfurtransferase